MTGEHPDTSQIPMTRASRLAGQALWASGGQLAQALLATLGTVVLVRLLGAEAYGLFALGLLFTGAAEVVVGGHSADWLVQRETVERRHENAAFAVIAGASVVTALVIAACGPLAARLFEAPELEALLPAMAVLPLLTGLVAVPTKLLVRRLRFDSLAHNGTVTAALAVATGVTLAVAGAGVWSLVVMEIARRTAALLLILPAANWRPGLACGRADLWSVVRYSLRRVENHGLTFLSQTALPRVVIGEALGPAALGVYTVLRRLLDQVHGILSGPAAAVAFPAAARLQEDPARLTALLTAGIRLTTWTYWPAILGIIVTAPLLVPLAFGPDWTGAVPVLQLLAIGSLRVPLSSFNSAVLIAFGRLRDVSRTSLLAVLLGAVLLPLGVLWGLTGVAAALALRQWIMWPVGALYVRRVSGYGLRRQLRVAGYAGLPSVVMAAAVLLLQRHTAQLEVIPALLLQVGAGVAVYGLAWAAFHPRNTLELLRGVRDILAGDRARAKSRITAIVGTRPA